MQNNGVTFTADVTHTAHVLNTIDEEETAEDDKPCGPVTAISGRGNGSDSECEVTVTIKLPTKKKNGADKTEKETITTADSPVDFWQQINDGVAGLAVAAEDQHTVAESCASSSSTASDSELSEDIALKSPSDAAYRLNVTVNDCKVWRSKSEDADSGITTSSVDFNGTPQTSEMDMNSGDGGSNAKKYQRTCTHSRLFDFLQDDDSKQSLQLTAATEVPVQSSCTSGYSSAATTPTTPYAVKGRYESDSNRTEYDNYYKSWEYACPYFGYDILPSKAFKTIAVHGGCSSTVTNSAVKFKCPKIPIEKNGS